jgi:hypothetical protein
MGKKFLKKFLCGISVISVILLSMACKIEIFVWVVVFDSGRNLYPDSNNWMWN